jgi:hypothetical protein
MPIPVKNKNLDLSPHLERLSLGPRSPIVPDHITEKMQSFTEKRKKIAQPIQ